MVRDSDTKKGSDWLFSLSSKTLKQPTPSCGHVYVAYVTCCSGQNTGLVTMETDEDGTVVPHLH